MSRSPRRDYRIYRTHETQDAARADAARIRADWQQPTQMRVRVKYSTVFGFAVEIGVPRTTV